MGGSSVKARDIEGSCRAQRWLFLLKLDPEISIFTIPVIFRKLFMETA
jgi:hypothetical protein